MKALLAVLVLSVFLLKAYASTQLGFPGGVPKDDSRPYASDLFYQDKVLLPAELRDLKNSGTDLSAINPKESDLWKDQENTLEEAAINFENGEGLQYLSFVLSRSGNFRFSAIKDDGASKKIYTGESKPPEIKVTKRPVIPQGRPPMAIKERLET